MKIDYVYIEKAKRNEESDSMAAKLAVHICNINNE